MEAPAALILSSILSDYNLLLFAELGSGTLLRWAGTLLLPAERGNDRALGLG